MFRFWVAIKKEFLILLNDKTGLALMFFMPILLVYVITIIQDSAFRIVNENKITALIINKDKGEHGRQLVQMMNDSRFFTITENDQLDPAEINKAMNDGNHLTGLIIPSDFSEKLALKSNLVSDIMMEELELQEAEGDPKDIVMPALKFHHDPVLQDNFCTSIINIVNAYVKSIEGDLLITHICEQLDLKQAPQKLKEAVTSNEVTIEKLAATLSDNDITPNSTQHNVPAWTIFAIFFMVISLGNNIVKERLNGSFIRLKTMPTSFSLILGAKFFVYLIAVILQVILIFSLAKLTFTSIGLPELTMPSNLVAFCLLVIVTGFAAIGFAMAVGTSASTQEQANGFGGVTIVILAAVGGIWVPSFAMPDYIKLLSYCSPLYWSLEGFYTLFLRGGNWSVLFPSLLGLTIFSLACYGVTYLKLKKNRII